MQRPSRNASHPLFAWALFVAIAGTTPARGEVPASEDCTPLDFEPITQAIAPAIESFTLGNGLRVHLAPRRDEHSATVRITYDVGARDEVEGRGGVAHLFEHMMFKGSVHLGDGEHFRVVRDQGGQINAETAYDTTAYWNTVPSHSLRPTLFAEADRMRGIRITQANLDNQRAAIEEEGLGLDNLPYVAAAADFGLSLWEGTPYGHSPIGTKAELAAVTVSEAKAFHKQFYSPSNAVLVVAGGFNPVETRHDIERFFSSIPADQKRPERESVSIERQPRSEVALDPLAPFPVYAVIWHGVGATHPDAVALGVLDDLLLGHPNARFARKIRGTLALDAYSLPVAFRDVGLLNFVFAPRTFAGFGEIQAVIRREVLDLRNEGPGEAELCASIRHEQAERLAALETHAGLATAVSEGVLLHGNPRHFEQTLRSLGALRPVDVQQAAQRHLDTDFLTLEIQPKGLMRWLKPILEFLPQSVGASLEGMLL